MLDNKMWTRLLVCISILIAERINFTNGACQDSIPNCSDYTNGICVDPLYSQWVLSKCAKFCKKCTGTDVTTTPPHPVFPTIAPASACVDKIPNCKDYGQQVCSDAQYTQWVTENCELYCQKCPSGVATTTQAPTTHSGDGTCRDKIAVCSGYTKSVCDDSQYENWVLENCAAYCNKCGGATTPGNPVTIQALGDCHDGISNCQDYGSGVCVDPVFSTWVLQNCAQHCKRCDGQSISNTECLDNADNCADLKVRAGICSDASARLYVDQNCRRTCGLCTVSPSSCADAIPNCRSYGSEVCTNSAYRPWVQKNCAKTCNSCPTATDQPATGSVGKTTVCVYKEKAYAEGETWKDGCKYNCQCKNGTTGEYNCQQMCLTWNLPDVCSMAPAAAGKCCPTPSCPSYINIKYPAGYVEQ